MEVSLYLLKQIILNVPNYIFWKDTKLKYRGCNNNFAHTFGFVSVDDLIGRTDLEMPWANESANIYRKEDEQILKTGKPLLNKEVSMILPKEGKRILSVSKVALYDKNGEIDGVLGIYIDITNIKNNERRLTLAKKKADAANHAKTEFIANMSHDIRTPLTGVIGMSKKLEERTHDPEQKKYAHFLGESGDKLLHMLNDILDVIKAGSINDSDLHEGAFDVHDVLENIVQLERPTILNKCLELKVDISDDIPICLIGDHKKLSRILLNLLGNAIKFTDKGYVKLSITLLKTLKKHVSLRFIVSDTGIGIEPELQKHVFDRFFRVTPSYEGVYTGHGVGLHLAQSYAHLLGSNITLTSKLNIGTTFLFDVKFKAGDSKLLDRKESHHEIITEVKNEPETVQPNICSSISTNSSKKYLHVLLVEDNKIALIILEDMVKKVNLSFVSATNGKQAYELATTQDFDFIITDLGLPILSGIDFTHKYRSFEKSKNKHSIPIIGLTAHASDKEKQKCKNAGMNDVLAKPLAEGGLLSIIDTYLPITTHIDTKKNSKANNAPKKKATNSLGMDLPATEEELFIISSLPLLDTEGALATIGNDQELFKTILQSMTYKDLPKDLDEIHQEYVKGDWSEVERLTHRLKGGLAYLGTIRLSKACLYLERYHKAGHRQQLEKLYQQLRGVADETLSALKDFIEKDN